jgi:hypothetical protein
VLIDAVVFIYFKFPDVAFLANVVKKSQAKAAQVVVSGDSRAVHSPIDPLLRRCFGTTDHSPRLGVSVSPPSSGPRGNFHHA